MKTDRELLELAAKAAGFDEYTEWDDLIEDYDSPHLGFPALHKGEPFGQCETWNPLIDDGDALRLAVKLNMLCDFGSHGVLVEAKDGPGPCTEIGDYRRAIVRAAAAIGEDMP